MFNPNPPIRTIDELKHHLDSLPQKEKHHGNGYAQLLEYKADPKMKLHNVAAAFSVLSVTIKRWYAIIDSGK